jgi:hypothetical protein
MPYTAAVNEPAPEPFAGLSAPTADEYRYCVMTIAAVRVSGMVTEETRLVSGG